MEDAFSLFVFSTWKSGTRALTVYQRWLIQLFKLQSLGLVLDGAITRAHKE
jgi:hypothetical protein